MGQAFKIARKHLPDDRGILMQFFGLSHQNRGLALYDLLDRHAYAFLPLGVPYPGGQLPSHYIWRQDLKKHLQVRLVISNRYTLNPNSRVSIKRYGGIKPAAIKNMKTPARFFSKSNKSIRRKGIAIGGSCGRSKINVSAAPCCGW